MADEPQVITTTETIDPAATGTQDTNTQAPGETPAQKWTDWDALVKAHPEVDELYEGKTKGLKSALDKERERAETSTKDLRKLAKEADEKTAAALTKLADEKDAEVASARQESAFYREAAAAGVHGDVLARAWLICKNGDYFTKRGDPDIASMKTELPELFAAPAVPAPHVNAGPGNQQSPAQAADFDAVVRAAARRGT
jgi:hypothetical protein